MRSVVLDFEMLSTLYSRLSKN